MNGGDTLRVRLLAAYADEHRDHLAAVRAVLDAGQGDLEDAYRHAHSLKGAARAVDLPAVVELAHGLESLLEAWWESGVAPDAHALVRARAAADAIEDLSAAALGTGTEAAAPEDLSATLRVEADTVDRLALSTARLLGELERRRAMAGEGDWELERAAEAVADEVARLRLVAAELTLGNFGPMLRALAAEQGKDVRYDASGLGTRADRAVLTAVAEAVMHLLRNAIAHGIETPAERLAAGKPPAGRLTLAVTSSGTRLDIRITDDGAGIPVASLAREAVERGVISAEHAATMDADRLRQLIFHPGLSTAASLSTAAGRGMGMAIVRRLVENLQGQIELRAPPGGGTEVILRLPVSIVVQRMVLVRAGGQLFGLPSAAVARVQQVPHAAVRTVAGRAAVAVDEGDVPLADLGALLGLPGIGAVAASFPAVLLRAGPGLLALAVQEPVDVRDLWVSPLEPPLADDPRWAGTVTLTGGGLALVLSPAGLAQGGSAPPPAQGARRLPPLVLVVDDSPTIRALERTILEANSYRVEVAVDGREALDAMARRRPDVVVSDVEMPRLDGFGLLAAMQADPALAAVPVVLLSSRASDADRSGGLEAGARAYLTKTHFDQREFLATIERLTA